ncbi:MAG: hypothetical protein IJR61_07470 [Clostridia bacterium]|nr:hypothetical protein [Clostridia bacterium]
MKKIIVLLLVLCVGTALFSCKKEKVKDSTGEGTSASQTWEEAKSNSVKITVYMDESNVYGAYVRGSEEKFVKDAVEKKFWEDTGNAIDLNVIIESHSTFSNSFAGVMSTGAWDAAVSYLGQAGLEETVLNNDVTLDLTDSLRRYGSHIYGENGAVDDEALYAVTNFNEEIIGIPSVNLTKQKGVLVRKDYITAVGYTESKTEAENSGGTLKYCGTIKDFDQMVRKMKAEIPKCVTPLSGNVYDMEFTLLAGAYGTAGYQYRSINYNDNGTINEVVPGWISENYGKVLKQEYDWVKDEIWEADNATITESVRLSNLAAGKTAVYFANPTVTNLIDVSRRVKAIDSSAEFVLLDPLDAVDESGNAIEGTGAFVEVSRTTDCLIVNKKSKKADLVIKYLDWMYSDKDNYELCAYGVKGSQWKDSSFGSDYYEYADDYYVDHRPYSGVYALLHNDEISCRILMQYSETERNWIEKVRNYPCLSNPTDGMLFYGMSALINSNFVTAEADMYLNCATKAWAGASDPAVTWPAACEHYRNQAGDYIVWLTNQYKLYKAARSNG